jgi:dihydrodipicolinate synthase/N-acetylneuraminate lyase
MSGELLDIRGIVTVLNTPFTDHDSIALDAVARNVERAVRAGVAGFLVPALASEVSALSADEREELVRCVVEAAGGRVPVICGCSGKSQKERISNLELSGKLGCAGGLVALTCADEASYSREVAELSEAAPGFLVIQDWDPSGYGAPVPLIARLFRQLSRFRAIKVEVVPAGRKYTEILEATGGRLHVSGGWAVSQIIEGLDRGVHAFMPTGMHEIYTRIYNLYRSGRRDDAQALFGEILPILAFSNQHLDISIHFFKRLLYREGIFPTARVRQKTIPFDAYHERTAEELIARAMRITESVRD